MPNNIDNIAAMVHNILNKQRSHWELLAPYQVSNFAVKAGNGRHGSQTSSTPT